MRRWIAILLLALLPFQFTWAGAVDFCAHAEGQVQHGAASQADDADGGSVPSQAGAEAGCEQCPCHAVGLVGAIVALAPQVPTAALSKAGPAHVADTVPALPERPQWANLA